MEKPEDKPQGPGNFPPRPPAFKKPELPKGPVPPRGMAPGGKLPLPGQKPGASPLKPASLPGAPAPMGNAMPKPAMPPVPGPAAARPPMPSIPGRPPVAPPPTANTPMDKGLAEAESGQQQLEGKIADLEKKLLEEREKVLLASLRSKEEEAVSAKVETSIKDIQDKLRREKKEQELEESRRKAENRVLEMERRLAEEREAWVQTLKSQLGQRDQITGEMESHFSSRLKDLEYRWAQEKSGLENAVKEREADLVRVRQEMALKSEQEKAFWEERLRSISNERDKFDRDLDRAKDRFQQEKEQLLHERQLLREQVSRLEANLKIAEDQQRLERSSAARELENAVELAKRQNKLEIERFERDLSTIQTQLHHHTKELIERNAQVDTLKGTIAHLQSQEFALKLQVNSEKESKEKEIAALNAQLQVLTRDAAEKAAVIDGLRIQLNQAQSQLSQSQSGTHQSRIEKLQQDLDHALKENRSQENLLQELQIQRKRLEQSLNEARETAAEKERELHRRRQDYDAQLESMTKELQRVRMESTNELNRLQHEADTRLKTLQTRLDWYDSNANREYDLARDKVRTDMDALQIQLAEANRKIAELSQFETVNVQLTQERDGLRTELRQIEEGSRNRLDQMVRQLKEEREQEVERLQKANEVEVKQLQAMREQELAQHKEQRDRDFKQYQEMREQDQMLIKQRGLEIAHLQDAHNTIKKNYEALKEKVAALERQLDEEHATLEGRNLQSLEDLRQKLDDATRELEATRHSLRKYKDMSLDLEKAEEVFKEKERALKTVIDDKQDAIAELKSRVQSLERSLRESHEEIEAVKESAKKLSERASGHTDKEFEERLNAEKAKLIQAHQEELQQRCFQAAQEAAERVRAEMPSMGQNFDMAGEKIRQEVEKEMAVRLAEEQTKFDNLLREAKDEAKKDTDRLKWENESMKEELKRTREARLQIEKEAQQLLQEAEDHYRAELERHVSELKGKLEKERGLFTSIGKFLDIPLVEFGKKKDNPPAK